MILVLSAQNRAFTVVFLFITGHFVTASVSAAWLEIKPVFHVLEEAVLKLHYFVPCC